MGLLHCVIYLDGSIQSLLMMGHGKKAVGQTLFIKQPACSKMLLSHGMKDYACSQQ